MTYIVKQQNDGTVGIYDDVRGCYPIEGPELRKAGVGRIEGSGKHGWFTKAETAKAEEIAARLNEFHGHIENATKALKAAGKAAAEATDSLKGMADALIADQAVAG
jgi:hypothetical protein